MLVAMTNDICVKYSMATQAYKVVNTHIQEISGWTILSWLLHSCAPSFGGMNGDVQSDLATLAFKNIQQLEDFNSIIIRLQQEIILSGETLSPTRFLFQSMKVFLKSKKIKALILPNMRDLFTFPDNNERSDVYTGEIIHGLYHYLEIIGSPNTLTTSGHCYHHFGPSSWTIHFIATIQPVIADFRMR